MTKRQIKIRATGEQVARLKKGKTVTYLNPVAEERAKLMEKHFKYSPLIQDVFTLKPNSYYDKD